MRFLPLLILTTFLAGPPLAAKTKPLPLPPQLMQAKTVYIDNQSHYASVGDQANTELSKWGRLQVVADRKSADLVLKLTARTVKEGRVSNSTSMGGRGVRNTSGSSMEMTSMDVTVAITPHGSKDILWQDTSDDAGHLIKGLRKRIEEQEKSAGAAQP